MEAGRASTAVVIDIIYRDGGHAKLVENALAACGVAIAVASYTLVDVVVVDMRVEEGFDAGLCIGLYVSTVDGELHERLDIQQHGSSSS